MTRLGLAALIALAPTAAAAQGDGVAGDDLVARGIEARRAGDDEGARSLFEQAWQTDGEVRALAQLGLAEQALGRWVDARAHLAEAMATDDPWIAEHRAVLEDALRVIEGHLGRVSVDADVDGAAVQINGVDVGNAPVEDAPVEVGTVVVQVTAPGRVAVTRTTTVRAGGLARVSVSLVPVEAGGGSESEPSLQGLAAAGSSENAAGRRGGEEDEEGALAARARAGSESESLAATGSGDAGLSALGAVLLAAGGLVLGGAVAAAVVREEHVLEWNEDERCPPTPPEGRRGTCAGVESTFQTAEALAITGAVLGGALALGGIVTLIVALSGGDPEVVAARAGSVSIVF